MNYYHAATRHNIRVLLAIPTALLLLVLPVVRGDCPLSDTMVPTGYIESGGYFAYSCIDETHFEGSQGYCQENGVSVDAAVVLECRESVPYCVQCGTAERGEALCLGSPAVPDFCDDDHVGPPGRLNLTTISSSASSSLVLRYGEGWMVLASAGTIWLFSLIP